MKTIILVCFVVLLQSLNPGGVAVAPQNTVYKPTCADYRMWYEQAREREYDQFRNQYRFADLHVTTYPDRRLLKADELMGLLDAHRKELGIDSISLGEISPRSLPIDNLLYPQYFDEYTISRQDWDELQRRAREYLASNRGAVPDVIAHWKSIAAGNPPFGLKVRK